MLHKEDDMRRFLYVILVSIVAVAASAQIRSLDEAIQESVSVLKNDLKPEETIASLHFASGSEGLSQFILEELAVALVNGSRQRSVDRWNLDTLRKERGFQMSGEVSDDEMRSIGKMLGAQVVLSGSILDRGLSYQFRLFAIDVESGVHKAASSIQVNIRDPTVGFFLGVQPSPVAGAGLSSASGEYAVGAQPNPIGTTGLSVPSGEYAVGAQPNPIGTTGLSVPSGGYAVGAQSNSVTGAGLSVPSDEYAVGDRGPAGGIIFYDKKVRENGWRYLEAAPQDLGPVRWGAATVFVEQTKTELGAGQQNTGIIVSVLGQLWENGTAAQLCLAFTYGGYHDWFLPSRDELSAMYTALKLRGIGNFAEDFYWSSSHNTSNYVWIQHFGDTMPLGGVKNNAYRVRPVRRF
jgi:hypothetical protein